MSISEQIKRIIKAAPHFPIQALTGLSILFFAIPVLVLQLIDEGMIQWVETKGIIADHQGVHERQRNGQAEYFYYITYGFDVNGKSFNTSYEKAFSDNASAEADMHAKLSESGSITVWYDKSDPSRANFEKEAQAWPAFLGVLILAVLMLAYFRWLMLKYYELEMTPD